VRGVLRRVAGAVLVVALVAGPAGGAAATQEPPPTSTTAVVADRDLPGVIPRPNEGREPQQAGDPGGWLQLTLAALVVVAVAVIFAIVARSAARTTRAKRLE
jgi:hypothetical protein